VQSTSITTKDKQPEATDAALRRFVGYRLKRAYNTVSTDLKERLEPLGLRVTTFSTLLLIVDQPGLRQSALASLLDIKSSNMVAIIDDLESRQWISRERMPDDRRAFALYATDAGRSIYDKAVAISTENESVVLRVLDEAELLTLMSLLAKIDGSKRID